MSLIPIRTHLARVRGDLTMISTLEALTLTGLISVGIWTLIGVTIFGT